MHHDLRASSGFTFYFNRSAFVSHDAIYGGESQSIALSELLGGKKRLEEACAGFGVHATTAIADGKRDPCVAKLVMRFASQFGPITVSGVNGNSAAVRHG